MSPSRDLPDWVESARDVAVSAAREAGSLIRKFDERPDLQDVSFKGRRDPVTEADRRSETLIRQRIRDAFPTHRLLGEEGGEERGDGGLETAPKWYVDPLDGTVNFAHGLPIYTVSIALAIEQELCLGVVYAPRLDEMYVGLEGRGTTLNGRSLRVSRTDRLGDAVVSTGFGYKRDQVADNNVAEFNRVILQVRGLRRFGSAAWDLATVAAGRFDAHWERHLSSWDLAAGVVLVREAGGSVTDLDGGGRFLETGSILASNGPMHSVMMEALHDRR